ncbi:MAG: N-acetyltransferase family protein, partial [Halohasta sp.]
SWVEMLLEEGHNIVADGPEGLVGHAVYTPVEAAQPELAVFVHPAFHDRGIGTELCKRIAAAAADAGREALELHVERHNRAAIAVYRRIGFEVVDDDHSIQMVLPLDEAVTASVRTPRAEQSPKA